ncbi:GntR family transcriptional regulator [Naumannella halotolerans]|uniref:GntR family transcriptional regulator n=1 Tax=Naumannella halotolerans TaxID=993414 RepID=A0A4R7JBZ1_9ACTN|nr:GntR family transcriptional regulator [Naumannella halotolerans]TDT34526.1 GntR family transcriptional regulator [Naumannella halotolerans]
MPDPLVEHPPGVDPVVSSGTPARPTTKRSQVKLMLAELIDGQLSAGEAIQSERNLVRELGVSRVTVRQAISDLVAEGRLERVHGKGTYVTGPRVDSRLHLTSFSREMRARGLEPGTRVLDAGKMAAPPQVAHALRIATGDPVVRVERLRTADGTPMAHELGYYPCAYFPDLLDKDLGSLYDIFASDYAVIATSGEQTVHAGAADSNHARILGVPKRAPLLVQDRVTWSGERAIEYATSWYRGDRYRIHMAVTPHGAREG